MGTAGYSAFSGPVFELGDQVSDVKQFLKQLVVPIAKSQPPTFTNLQGAPP